MSTTPLLVGGNGIIKAVPFVQFLSVLIAPMRKSLYIAFRRKNCYGKSGSIFCELEKVYQSMDQRVAHIFFLLIIKMYFPRKKDLRKTQFQVKSYQKSQLINNTNLLGKKEGNYATKTIMIKRAAQW